MSGRPVMSRPSAAHSCLERMSLSLILRSNPGFSISSFMHNSLDATVGRIWHVAQNWRPSASAQPWHQLAHLAGVPQPAHGKMRVAGLGQERLVFLPPAKKRIPRPTNWVFLVEPVAERFMIAAEQFLLVEGTDK